MIDAPASDVPGSFAPPTRDDPPSSADGWLAAFGTFAGLAGLVASSCCVLPVALAGMGASGAVFAGLGLLWDFRPYLLVGAGLALVGGWSLFFRRTAFCDVAGRCAGTRPTWRTALLLGSGTTLVALATVWEPYVEPLVLRAMR